jgi:hypothetical protein
VCYVNRRFAVHTSYIVVLFCFNEASVVHARESPNNPCRLGSITTARVATGKDDRNALLCDAAACVEKYPRSSGPPRGGRSMRMSFTPAIDTGITLRVIHATHMTVCLISQMHSPHHLDRPPPRMRPLSPHHAKHEKQTRKNIPVDVAAPVTIFSSQR